MEFNTTSNNAPSPVGSVGSTSDDRSTVSSSTASSSRDRMVEDIMRTFQRKGYKVSAYAFKSPRSSPKRRLSGVPELPLTPSSPGDGGSATETTTTAGITSPTV
mmetsp:Transcript_21982/g.62609  ORF Transcript_21982/g.62609 Transcript_21982/m.62609 type:complete len:104 (+) Transcript_21982:242-553(+)